MKREQIFRSDAVLHKKEVFFQENGFYNAPSPRLLFGVLTCLLAVSVALLTQISYTSTTQIAGELTFDRGPIRISAIAPGRVDEVKVVQGQTVKRGDVLLVISTARQSNGDKDIDSMAHQSALLREQLINTQLDSKLTTNVEQIDSLTKRRAHLKDELAKLINQGQLLGQRVGNSNQVLVKFRELRDQGFISDIGLLQKEDELIDTKLRHEQTQREISEAEKTILEIESSIRTESDRYKQDSNELQRLKVQIKQDGEEAVNRRSYTITADQDGVVTALLAKQGQSIAQNAAAIYLAPKGASLVIKLYAPSKVIGFLHEGMTIQAMYTPFPFQKYGLHEATVSSVTSSAVPVVELGIDMPKSESAYIVTATPTRTQLKVNDKSMMLLPGMQVKAEINTSKRKLYEWVLNPAL